MIRDVALVIAAFHGHGASLDYARRWYGTTHIYRHTDNLVDIRLQYVPPGCVFCVLRPNCHFTTLENYGRESKIYLHHIISRYDRLEEFTIFLQEDEMANISPMAERLQTMQWAADTIAIILPAVTLCAGGQACGQNFCWETTDLAPYMREALALVNRSCPPTPFPCYLRGVFGVNRNLIRQHSVHVYLAMLSLLHPTHTMNARGCVQYGRDFGHVMERIWGQVFLTPHVESATRCVNSQYPLTHYAHETSRTPRLGSVVCFYPSFFTQRYEAALISPSTHRAIRAHSTSMLNSTACAPPGYMLLSIATHDNKDLRTVQFQRLGRHHCVTPRMLSLCYGFDDAIGTCITPNDTDYTASSLFFKGETYNRLTWTKWSFVSIVLERASSVVFIDTDVLVLKNPLILPRTSSHLQFAYQAETPCRQCASCFSHHADAIHECPTTHRHCPINGGQLLLRSWDIATWLVAQQPVVITGGPALDQNFIDDALDSMLDTSSFGCLPWIYAGHCWYADFDRIDSHVSRRRLFMVHTYHMHCISGQNRKLEAMRGLLRRFH